MPANLTPLAAYAALADYIYRRATQDQSIELKDIQIGGTQAKNVPRNPINGLEQGDDNVYYGRNTGFVGQIVDVGGKAVVVLRGTDMVGGLEDALAGLLGWGNPEKVDNLDFQTNGRLGAGYDGSERTQLDDALALARAAVTQFGASNVVITGQSLGGGLAELVTGILNGEAELASTPQTPAVYVQGYAFASAPFENQLEFEAVKWTIRVNTAWSVPAEFYGWPIGDERNFIASQYGQAAGDKFMADFQRALGSFRAHASADVAVHTINGEALSSGLIVSTAIALSSDPAGPIDQSYNVGSGSEVSLHGASLHALVIRTHGTDTAFATLLAEDKALREAILDKTGISGSLDHARIDSIATSSTLGPSGPNPTVMLRALWKGVGEANSLYSYFYKVFHETMAGGAVAEHRSADNSGWLHRAAVSYALSVLRDGLENTTNIQDLRAKNNGAYFHFAGNSSEGAPYTDRIVIDTSLISQKAQPAPGTPEEEAQDTLWQDNQRHAHGFHDLAMKMTNEIEKDLLQSSVPVLLMDTIVEDILGANKLQIFNKNKTPQKLVDALKVLVIQGGTHGSPLQYVPQTNHADKSHVLVGGDGSDMLEGSSQNDYVLGGRGADEYRANGGKDVFAGGDGIDKYIAERATITAGSGVTFIGGQGRDLADYKTDPGLQNLTVEVANSTRFVSGGVTAVDVKYGTSKEALDTLLGVEVVNARTDAQSKMVLEAAGISGELHLIDDINGSQRSEIQLRATDPALAAAEGFHPIFFEQVIEQNAAAAAVAITVDPGIPTAERVQNAIFVNGQQLVGGVRFAIDYHELGSTRADPITQLSNERKIVTWEQKDEVVFQLLAKMMNLDLLGSGSGTPLFGGVGVAFGLAYNELQMQQASSTVESAYNFGLEIWRVVGQQGEIYELTSNGDGTSRLDIKFYDPSFRTLLLTETIDRWTQGDFGIRLELGLKVLKELSGNNRMDGFAALATQKAQILAELRRAGLVSNEQAGASAGGAPDAQGADRLASPEAQRTGFGAQEELNPARTPDLHQGGSDGNDDLRGGDGDDFFNGSGGADQLSGGAGEDEYFVEGGDGTDLIIEVPTGGNIVAFGRGITPESVSITKGGAGLQDNDLVIDYVAQTSPTATPTTGRVVVRDWFAMARSLEWSFVWSDGQRWSAQDLLLDKGIDLAEVTGDNTGIEFGGVFSGTGAADSLTGAHGLDRIIGNAGNDSLAGGASGDTYVYALGDGSDTISDGAFSTGRDILELTDIAATGVTYERAGNGDLLIRMTATGQTLTVAGHFAEINAGLERIAFADGVILTKSDIAAKAIQTTGFGNAADTIVIDAADPAPRTLDGAGGDDIIEAGAGDDVLIGGTGIDLLGGRRGSDTYIWQPGDGNDVILDDSEQASADQDVIVLKSVAPSAVVRLADGLNLGIEIVSETLEVRGYYQGHKIEEVRFDDGTVWDAAAIEASVITLVRGTAGVDWLIGTMAADRVEGLADHDTLYGLDGDDSLRGGTGIDWLEGGAGSDALVGGAGDDTYVVDDATDVVTELTGEGIDSVQSAVTYTLTNHVENLTLVGTAAINGTGNVLANRLTGNLANNTLNGGAGADTLVGRAGDDIYVVDAATDVVTERSGEGTDTIQSAVTINALAENVENLTLTGAMAINGTGNALANTLRGNSANNTLNGGAGRRYAGGRRRQRHVCAGRCNRHRDRARGRRHRHHPVGGHDRRAGGERREPDADRNGRDQRRRQWPCQLSDRQFREQYAERRRRRRHAGGRRRR